MPQYVSTIKAQQIRPDSGVFLEWMRDNPGLWCGSFIDNALEIFVSGGWWVPVDVGDWIYWDRDGGLHTLNNTTFQILFKEY